MDEPKPCPFCASDKIGIGRGSELNENGALTHLYCVDCGAQGPSIRTRDKGIWTCTALACDKTGWNRREWPDDPYKDEPDASLEIMTAPGADGASRHRLAAIAWKVARLVAATGKKRDWKEWHGKVKRLTCIDGDMVVEWGSKPTAWEAACLDAAWYAVTEGCQNDISHEGHRCDDPIFDVYWKDMAVRRYLSDAAEQCLRIIARRDDDQHKVGG